MDHQYYTPIDPYYRWHRRQYTDGAGNYQPPSIPPGSVVRIVEENGKVYGHRHVRVAGTGCGGGIFFRFLEPVSRSELEPEMEIAYGR